MSSNQSFTDLLVREPLAGYVALSFEVHMKDVIPFQGLCLTPHSLILTKYLFPTKLQLQYCSEGSVKGTKSFPSPAPGIQVVVLHNEPLCS